jgi:hypothetical protein
MADNDEGMWGCFGFFVILGIVSSIPWLMGTYPAGFAGTVAVGFVALIVLGRAMEARERTPSPPPGPEIKYLESPPLQFEEARDWRAEPVVTLAAPLCPVCRSELGDDVILCWRCRTPHHRRCFRYTGECAVYACKCRRYRRAG